MLFFRKGILTLTILFWSTREKENRLFFYSNLPVEPSDEKYFNFRLINIR